MIGKTCKLCKTDPSIQTQFRLSQSKQLQLFWCLSEWQLRLVGKFIPNLRIHCWDSALVAVWRAAVFVKFLLELPVAKFGREAFVNKLCEFDSYASVVFLFIFWHLIFLTQRLSLCSTNVVKVQVSSILKEKSNIINTNRIRSQSARSTVSRPNH